MTDRLHLLIFTPTYDNGLRSETVRSIVAQQTAHVLTWDIGRCNPYPGRDMRNVLTQYNTAREMCLSGPYDAMITIEHDMVIPPHAVRALCDTPAPVVYASYPLRPDGVLNTWQYVDTRGLGMSLQRYPAELYRYRQAGVGRVSGVGFGCTLIRRQVLEEISFRTDYFEHAPDMPFAHDCVRKEILQLARFDVECGHIHKGATLEINSEGTGMVTVKCIQPVNILVNGGGVALNEGDVLELPPEQAKELASLGYVELAKPGAEPTAPKVPRK
jgi:hypothetical protein